jgi:DNA-directed RNA polymerase specialized sigma subunit
MSADVVTLPRRPTAREKAELALARSEVRRLAAQIIATRPRLFRASGVEHADLVAAGDLAVSQAMPRWDPDRGVSLALYARKRIDGAMIDLLRGETAFPEDPPRGRGERSGRPGTYP